MLGWLFDVLLILAIVGAVHWWQTKDMLLGVAPTLGSEVPDLFVETLRPPAEKQASLVVFWAEWCPICRLELTTLQALSRDYRVQTVASQSGNIEAMEAFMQEQGVRFPVWIDENGQTAAAWQVKGFPAVFVVDSQGQIRYRLMGFSTNLGIRLRLWLASH